MPDTWYEVVDAATPITQGDLILDCPVMTWADNDAAIQHDSEVEMLRAQAAGVAVDVVIMTQACDLEHRKVNNVIMCPHVSLESYKLQFDEVMRARDENPTQKAWRRQRDDIKDGFLWNLAMLNAERHEAMSTQHRVVDFTEVFTVPRVFLESLLIQRNQPRLRLVPPYREHLSQAFARFFMRVGLPSPMSEFTS
jgi:hypothetical protein